MKELVEFMIKALVDEPSEVQITEVETEVGVQYKLQVSKKDIGKVIGKKGKTALSIRTILNAVSTKQGKRAELEIVE
jgi:predicted RNA-binding protein YlqC (UPF0109 family)